MAENHALAPLPQRTLAGWHRFVAAGDREPAGLAIVGTYCVSLAVRAIADSGAAGDATGADHGGADFREFYAITAPLSAAPTTSRWNLPPISANGSSRASISSNSMSTGNDQFEVMIRPIKALAALAEEIGNRIGPQLARMKAAARLHADLCRLFDGLGQVDARALARAGPLWQGSAPPVRAFWADSPDPGHAAVAQW